MDYSIKPSGGRRLNHYIQELKNIKSKLTVLHESTKAHGGSLFTPDARRFSEWQCMNFFMLLMKNI